MSDAIYVTALLAVGVLAGMVGFYRGRRIGERLGLEVTMTPDAADFMSSTDADGNRVITMIFTKTMGPELHDYLSIGFPPRRSAPGEYSQPGGVDEK